MYIQVLYHRFITQVLYLCDSYIYMCLSQTYSIAKSVQIYLNFIKIKCQSMNQLILWMQSETHKTINQLNIWEEWL